MKNIVYLCKILITVWFYLTKKNRNNDTLIHLLKGSLGTGILAMPNAFHNSGYIVGFVGTIVIGIICTYCIHMLLRSHYELCKRKKVIDLHKSHKLMRLIIHLLQTGSKFNISSHCWIGFARGSQLGSTRCTIYCVSS